MIMSAKSLSGLDGRVAVILVDALNDFQACLYERAITSRGFQFIGPPVRTALRSVSLLVEDINSGRLVVIDIHIRRVCVLFPFNSLMMEVKLRMLADVRHFP